MGDQRDQLKGVLASVAGLSGVTWAGIVSRDGLCVMEDSRREIPRETFAAMTATMMGAAEIALAELGGGRMRRVVAETERLTMVVTGATSELLLVVIVEQDAALDRLLPEVGAAAERIPVALSGG